MAGAAFEKSMAATARANLAAVCTAFDSGYRVCEVKKQVLDVNDTVRLHHGFTKNGKYYTDPDTYIDHRLAAGSAPIRTTDFYEANVFSTASLDQLAQAIVRQRRERLAKPALS